MYYETVVTLYVVNDVYLNMLPVELLIAWVSSTCDAQ